MFKKFDDTSVSGKQQLKSSVQKGIKVNLTQLYPDITPYIDTILPKKENFGLVKCHDHIEILVSSLGDQLFFKQREGCWFPTLRLLHQYPFLLAQTQVDRGAIKFVLSGANVMCPGMTSTGGRVAEVPKNTIVAIMAEGKTHAMAVGITLMSSEEIIKVNRGIGVEIVHYLNDGLWNMKPVK